MKHKKEYEKEREGAYQIADLILNALDKLPKDEQETRIDKIRKIKVIDRRSSPKPKIRRSHPTEAPQHKRARR